MAFVKILTVLRVTLHKSVHLSQMNTPRLNPSQTGRYSIHLPRTNGRLSWAIQLVGYTPGEVAAVLY